MTPPPPISTPPNLTTTSQQPPTTYRIIDFGAKFAPFPWHVEDHHLFSASYLYDGAHKTWYEDLM